MRKKRTYSIENVENGYLLSITTNEEKGQLVNNLIKEFPEMIQNIAHGVPPEAKPEEEDENTAGIGKYVFKSYAELERFLNIHLN